jgi:hypothetical protein
VQFLIRRTAAGVIRVGEPEIVFAQGRNNLPETPEARPGTTRLERSPSALLWAVFVRPVSSPSATASGNGATGAAST